MADISELLNILNSSGSEWAELRQCYAAIVARREKTTKETAETQMKEYLATIKDKTVELGIDEFERHPTCSDVQYDDIVCKDEWDVEKFEELLERLTNELENELNGFCSNISFSVCAERNPDYDEEKDIKNWNILISWDGNIENPFECIKYAKK